MVIITVLLSVILGCIFLASALPKLRYPKGFVLIVLEYRILPPWLGWIYARLLAPLEFLIALLLFTGTTIRVAGTLAALLFLSFIIAISINLVRGRRLDCHCFGKAAHRQIGWGLLLQDGTLLAASIVLVTLSSSWISLESWSLVRIAGLPSAISFGWFMGCVGLTLCAMFLLNQHGKSLYQANGLNHRMTR